MGTRPESKFHSLHEHVQSMPELCSKFQIPASNTVGVAETRTVLQYNMDKICMPFKGQNSAKMTWIIILLPLCKCSTIQVCIEQVSNPCIKYCRRCCGDTNNNSVFFSFFLFWFHCFCLSFLVYMIYHLELFP